MRHLFGIFCLFALASAASAGAVEPVLSAYLERALNQNPALQEAAQRYAAAQARIPQATALPDPRMEVALMSDSGVMQGGVDEVMLTQAFPWFGTLRKSGEAASAAAEALFFAFQDLQLELSAELAEGFYEYAYIGRAQEVTRANLRLLENLMAVVEQNVSGGGALNDLLRLEVETGRLDDRLRGLEELALTQRARLNALLGQAAESDLPLPLLELSDPHAPEADSLRRTMLEQHPRIRMMQRQIASEEARVAVARLQARPEFMAGVSYMPDRRNAPMEGSDAWGLRVGVSIPLWGDKNHGRREEALADRRAAEAALANLENQLRSELTIALSELRDADRRLRLYRERLLPVAEQALANVQESYRGGQSTVLDLIDSERSLLELQLETWRAAADAQQASARLALLTGTPLPTP